MPWPCILTVDLLVRTLLTGYKTPWFFLENCCGSKPSFSGGVASSHLTNRVLLPRLKLLDAQARDQRGGTQ